MAQDELEDSIMESAMVIEGSDVEASEYTTPRMVTGSYHSDWSRAGSFASRGDPLSGDGAAYAPDPLSGSPSSAASMPLMPAGSLHESLSGTLPLSDLSRSSGPTDHLANYSRATNAFPGAAHSRIHSASTGRLFTQFAPGSGPVSIPGAPSTPLGIPGSIPSSASAYYTSSSYAAAPNAERRRSVTFWPGSYHHYSQGHARGNYSASPSFPGASPTYSGREVRGDAQSHQSLLSSMIAQSRRPSTPTSPRHTPAGFYIPKASSTTDVSTASVATKTKPFNSPAAVSRRSGGQTNINRPAPSLLRYHPPSMKSQAQIPTHQALMSSVPMPPSTPSPPTNLVADLGPVNNYGDYFGIMASYPRPPRLTSFQFADCDPKNVLDMITVALNYLISRHDSLYPPDNDEGRPLDGPPATEDGERCREALLGFHGCNVPGINLEAYLSRILKYCPSTAEVFIAIVVYLDRISRKLDRMVLKGEPPPAPPPAQGPESPMMQLSPIKSPGPVPSGPGSGRTTSLFVLDSYNVHRLVIAGMTVASKFFSDVFYKNSRYAKVGGLPVEELNHLEIQFLLLMDFHLMVSVDELQLYADFLQNLRDYIRSSPGQA